MRSWTMRGRLIKKQFLEVFDASGVDYGNSSGSIATEIVGLQSQSLISGMRLSLLLI